MKTRVLVLAATLMFTAGMALAQAGTSNPDQNSNPNASSTQTQTTTTTQTPANNATESNQAAGQTATGDQNAAAPTGQLPQTASPLPLLALLGLGSVGAGALSRKKK